MHTASHPFVYEVQTRQWLHALSARMRAPIDLAGVPDDELDRIAALGVTHLWLMGVWPSGPRARAEALRLPALRRAYGEALPGFTAEDVAGSPYAVAAYAVAEAYGGEEALARLRGRLRERGMGLILDFVPNHMGLDHPWVEHHPERFVHAYAPFAGSFPAGSARGALFVAHGSDPFFPPWTDTAQLDLRRGDTRHALTATLLDVAARCDGVRCDMAMLVLSDVFAQTWTHVPCLEGQAPGEFWSDAIGRVKKDHPGFLFLAEAYWDLENRLCALGFDAAYDKKLYDFVMHGRPAEVQSHLLGMAAHCTQRVHFLENHDEPRAASRLAATPHRAAALLALGLPGVRLVHDGQTEGRRRFARIQLGRRAEAPDESFDEEAASFYHQLLGALPKACVGHGSGRLLAPIPAWEGNPSHQGFVLIQWDHVGRSSSFTLVVVNLQGHRAQCRVRLELPGIEQGSWHLTDLLGPERWVRAGDELRRAGLFLDVDAYAAQLFVVTRAESDLT